MLPAFLDTNLSWVVLAASRSLASPFAPSGERAPEGAASSHLPIFSPSKHLFDSAWAFRLGCPATQNNLISKFTKMVSAIESTIDQTRQPGMKRTSVRSPDRFQITNMAYAPCPAA